jgi:hypothetical protein
LQQAAPGAQHAPDGQQFALEVLAAYTVMETAAATSNAIKAILVFMAFSILFLNRVDSPIHNRSSCEQWKQFVSE